MTTTAPQEVPSTTLEWFGATTFRLKIGELVIFLDTWLDRPRNIPQYLPTADVKECDYILISHAHFDHLPGADIIAKNTGAKIIANGEAINVMRKAGVPEAQLIPIAGGERYECSEGVVILPQPSLHCLPGWSGHDHPEFMDTGKVYLGGWGVSTLNITQGLTKGFGGVIRDGPVEALNGDPNMLAFREYLRDTRNHHSFFDGGQMMYQINIGAGPLEKSILFSSHTGAYEGVIRSLDPKPDVAILGIAGRPNLDGKPYQGSAAEFVTREIEWLNHPERVIWCLHDQAPIKPFYIDTRAATTMVHERTRSKVVDLTHTQLYTVF